MRAMLRQANQTVPSGPRADRFETKHAPGPPSRLVQDAHPIGPTRPAYSVEDPAACLGAVRAANQNPSFALTNQIPQVKSRPFSNPRGW